MTTKRQHLRAIAGFCVILQISLGHSVARADDLPLLTDRTSEHLQGLENDSTVKTLARADFNNDGYDDLAIARRRAEPVLLINEAGVLTNRTSELLQDPGSSDNAYFVATMDANGDGFIDVLFSPGNSAVRLHLNRGMSNGSWLGFDSGTDLPATRNGLTIATGDITGDGTADDLFVNQLLSNNVLLINDGSGNFRDASDQLSTLRNTMRNGHFGLVGDANADGVDDIMYIEADDNLFVYYNDGSGNFAHERRKVFRNTNLGTPLAYTCGCADFNGDGIFDFAIHADGGGDDRLASFMSTGVIDDNGLPEHVYVDQPTVPGRMSRRHGLPDVGDIDGDGDLDYVQSSYERVHGTTSLRRIGVRTLVVLNTGFNSGIFEGHVGEDWGIQDSHDMKFIDINADGNLDMFIGHDSRYGVYINAAPPSTIELEDNVTMSAAEVGFSATLAVSLLSGTAASYEWDFGDGSSETSANPTIEHVYSEPGQYTVTVTVNGPDGSDQVSFRQTVYASLTNQQPSSSSGLAYEIRDDGADRIYVANPDHNQITVLDAASSQVIQEISVGKEPHGLALGATGNLYVVNKQSATISVVDTDSLSITTQVSLPYASRPHGIVIDAGNQFAYVALEALGSIVKLALPSLQTVGQIDTGPMPRELALTGDGQILYAPRFITSPLAGESTRNAGTSGSAEVLVIDTGTMSLTGVVEFGVNEVSEEEEEEGTSSRGIPNYLRAPVISRDGQTAVVPAKLDNIFRGSMRDGKARAHDKLVRGILLKFDTQTNQEIVSDRFDFDNNSPPTAVTYGPTGSYRYVIHEASRSFEVMDVYDNSVVFRTTAEFAPRSIVVSPAGDRVYIHNYMSRSVSIFDITQITANQSNEATLLATVSVVSNEQLSPEVLKGKQLFHDSEDNRLTTQGYISCAVCHDDAGHDGRTWDFSDAGEGLRNTIDLRGRAATRHGNVHWTGNFDEFHDFENDIREIFKGTGLMSDNDFADTAATLDSANPKAGRSADLDALAAFGASLTNHGNSPYRNADGSLTAAAVRGKSVFQAADCAACHNDSPFSDSPTAVGHNIGTVDGDTGGRLGQALLDGGHDTPTLRGLWHGAPYLHDGSALNLQEAVLAHTSGMNFDVALLSSSELSDLSAYLLQIDDLEPAATSSTTPPITPPDTGPSNPSGAILVDGNFSDWTDITAYAGDANDVSGANNTLDFAGVWLAHDANNLYVRYDNHAPNAAQISWGYSVQLDTDGNPATGFRGFSNELPIGVDYMIEGSTLHRYTGTGNDFMWGPGVSLPAASGPNSIELQVPRGSLNSPTGLRVFLYANNAAVNGTAVDFYPDKAGNTSATLAERSFEYYLGSEPVTPPSVPPAGAFYNPQTITVDGDIADWAELNSFGPDPDDASGAGNTIDWREGWIAHDANNFYFGWRNDEAAVISWGNGIMIDTDQDPGTGFKGFSSELSIGVDYLLEDRVIHRYTGTGTDWTWINAGSMEPVLSGNNTEIQLPRSQLGNPTAMNLFFSGNNVAVGGSVTDYYPNDASNTAASLNDRSFTYTTVEPTTPPVTPPTISPVSLTLDGVIGDWPTDSVLGAEDAIEMSGLNTIDWRSLRVTNDADNLYMAYQSWQPVTQSWGYGIAIDTDQNPATGFKGFSNELSVGAEYLLEGIELNRYTGATQNQWSWESAGVMTVAIAGNIAELSIPRSLLGNPVSVDLLMRGDNTAVDGDAVDYHPDQGATPDKLSYTLSFVQNDAP
ncbi:MAG: FG-GAP-like repeat-containing protein, partial [Granulosicoccus sp.]